VPGGIARILAFILLLAKEVARKGEASKVAAPQ